MQEKNADVRSDEEIISLYWARNEEAIVQTDFKYRRYLIKISQNILHNMQDSEECLDDTYIATWNSIPPHRPNVLQAFLAAIMRKAAITKYRSNHSKKRNIGAVFSMTDYEDFLSDSREQHSWQESAELGQVISDYLRTQTQRTQYIFISRYYFAKPIEQIAKEIGCSTSTVNKEIAKIKQEFKEYLAKEGYMV